LFAARTQEDMLLGIVRLALCLLLLFSVSLRAATVTINFDDLNDGDVVTTQYLGVTFSNAIILTEGFSLAQEVGPARSFANVASDNGGPLQIVFSSPVAFVRGYITYLQSVTLEAFGDAAGTVSRGSATSAFSSNTADLMDPIRPPNELIEVSSALGIRSVTFTGNLAGASLTLDDLEVEELSGNVVVPEPSSGLLLAAGALALAALRRR
jgi:hypothetical protein